MRSLGQIDGRKPTEQFVAFLLTQKIKTHIEGVDGKPDSWEIWVRNEDQLAEASKHLIAFKQDPTDIRYESAMKEATRLLDSEQKAKQAADKNIRRMDTSGTPRIGSWADSAVDIDAGYSCNCCLVSQQFHGSSAQEQ